MVDRLRASGSILGPSRRPGASLRRWLQLAWWRVHLRPALALGALTLALVMLWRGPSPVEKGSVPISPAEATPRPPAPALPPPSPRAAVDEPDVPRALSLGPRARRLSEVRTVEVDIPAGHPRAAQLREALVALLADHGLTAPASNRIADARLQGSLAATGGGARVRLALRLVNVDGQTLWSAPAVEDEDVRRLAERAAAGLVKAIAQRPSP